MLTALRWRQPDGWNLVVVDRSSLCNVLQQASLGVHTRYSAFKPFSGRQVAGVSRCFAAVARHLVEHLAVSNCQQQEATVRFLCPGG